MGYGLGVFLLAVGLILVYAVQDSISAVDLTTVGWILVLAGVLVIVLTAVTHEPRAHRAVGRDHDPPRRQPDHDRAAAAQRPAAGGLTARSREAGAGRRPPPARPWGRPQDVVLGAVPPR